MSFEEYLLQKKIDAALFKGEEPGRYKEFYDLFNQVHPNSFTMQKLNLINFIRRKYPLKIDSIPQEILEKPHGEAKPAGVTRPVFKRKPNIEQ